MVDSLQDGLCLCHRWSLVLELFLSWASLFFGPTALESERERDDAQW